MGANNDKNAGLVDLNIELQKTCYFPGEMINGFLILTPKPGITDAFFTDTKCHFVISQRQFYRYHTNSQYKLFEQVMEEQNLFEKDFNFDNFLNENILLEMKIPFSIQLPKNAYPSCYLSGDLAFVSHNLQVEFPNLKAYKSIVFIVKNSQYFNNENGLIKEPCQIFKNIFKSKFISRKGNFSVLIKLQKNYFCYDEPIIYDIYLDFSELDLEINELIIRLIKTTQKNFKNNHNRTFIKVNDDVAVQKLPIDKNIKKYHFKDGIKIDKLHIPSSAYQNMDINGPYEIKENKDNKDLFLTPCCYGGLITVSYCLHIKLVFDSLLTFNEEFNIPIDFYERQDNDIQNQNNNNLNNSDNLLNSNTKDINNNTNENNNEDNSQNIDMLEAPSAIQIIDQNNQKDVVTKRQSNEV